MVGHLPAEVPIELWWQDEMRLGQKNGLVRWRRVDLKAVTEEPFGVAYNERSVSRLLHELGFSHISARPG